MTERLILTVDLYKFFGISDEYWIVSCSEIEIKDQRCYNVFRDQNTFTGYEKETAVETSYIQSAVSRAEKKKERKWENWENSISTTKGK